jgi:predicted dehydrogenase
VQATGAAQLSSPSSRSVRIGLLGCGTIAYWVHLRVLSRIRGATLVAAADPDSEARARAARLVQVPVYESAEQLLRRDDIGAVVICAPTPLHADLAIATAKAGKHFYLEKPLATNAEDARRVVAAASEAGVMASVGFNRRWHPLYQQARNMLTQGRIGRVRVIQTAFCEHVEPEKAPAWKRQRATGGGVLLDLASHHIDLLRWFLNDEIGEVQASLGSELSEQDTALIQFTTLGGIQGQSVFSFRAWRADYIEFIGERGTLRVDRHSPPIALQLGRRWGYGVRNAWVAPTAPVAAWRLQRLLRPATEPSYRRSLVAFTELLQGRRTASELPSLVDGLRSLEIVLAAEKSAGVGE